MHGVICSPWHTVQAFPSQVKTELPTADCFSTRHLHLCHRLGSNTSETWKWDRWTLAISHLPHMPLTQWPDLTKFLLAVVIWINHYSSANIIHTIYCFPCLYLQECLSAVSFTLLVLHVPPPRHHQIIAFIMTCPHIAHNTTSTPKCSTC